MQFKNIHAFVDFVLASIYQNGDIDGLMPCFAANAVCSGYIAMPTVNNREAIRSHFMDGIQAGFVNLEIEIIDTLISEALPKCYCVIIDFSLRRPGDSHSEFQKKGLFTISENNTKAGDFTIHMVDFELIAKFGFDDLVPYTGLENELRKELVKNKLRLEIALKHSGLNIWEYNIKEKCIHQKENSVEMHGFHKKVPKVPQSLVESGYVHPDSAEAFLAMYDKIFAGEKESGGLFRVLDAKHKNYWWEKITYVITEFDKDQKPLIALGFSTDVSEYMNMKKILEQNNLTP